MKICKGCERELPVEQFNRHSTTKDKLNPKCKACQKEYRTTYYKTEKEQERLTRKRHKQRELVRDFVKKAKDVPCADCGVKYSPHVMDFDHINGDKEFTIGSRKGRSTIAQLEGEIKKCEVVCSNCHRERTWQRANDEADNS